MYVCMCACVYVCNMCMFVCMCTYVYNMQDAQDSLLSFTRIIHGAQSKTILSNKSRKRRAKMSNICRYAHLNKHTHAHASILTQTE